MRVRLLSLVFLPWLLAWLCFATSVVSAQARPEGPQGVIYYIEEPSPNKSFLCSINADGSDKTILTRGFHNLNFPRVCPKTGTIGFTNKTAHYESEIYLMVRKKVTKVLSNARLEDFSPRGGAFLWVSTDGRSALHRYDMRTKRSQAIATELKVATANYSLDGEWIVISANTEYGTTDLYLMSTITNTLNRLTNTREYNEACPVFCNDGKTILYLTDKYGSYEMEYMAVEVSEVYRPGLAGLFPTLSKDNEWIAYEADGQVKVATKTGLLPRVLSGGRTPFWLKN